MAEIELTLESLAFGGDAVGRADDGRVVFVARGAPGDRVVARVVEDKRSFVRAEALRVLSPGARIEPPCPIVDRCGGCPWQHVRLEAQLAAKQAIVERALRGTGVRVEPIAPSPEALGYRTRARMTVRGGAIGFSGRRSHEIVDVERCIAMDPALDAAMQRARRALGRFVGEDGTIAGLIRDEGVDIAVALGRGGDRARLVEAARAAGITRLSVDDETAPAAGFAQANAAQNATLQRLVRDAARADGLRVLELYAGDGNFTRVLDATGGVAVEGDRPAAARLRALALPGWEVVADSAARAVGRLRGERFDVVVLDPPRAGAADVAGELASFGAARVVYVSCDPMTLQRDVKTLVAAGYRAVTAWPVDMMPQTWHIETVLLLERSQA